MTSPVAAALALGMAMVIAALGLVWLVEAVDRRRQARRLARRIGLRR